MASQARSEEAIARVSISIMRYMPQLPWQRSSYCASCPHGETHWDSEPPEEPRTSSLQSYVSFRPRSQMWEWPKLPYDPKPLTLTAIAWETLNENHLLDSIQSSELWETTIINGLLFYALSLEWFIIKQLCNQNADISSSLKNVYSHRYLTVASKWLFGSYI